MVHTRVKEEDSKRINRSTIDYDKFLVKLGPVNVSSSLYRYVCICPTAIGVQVFMNESSTTHLSGFIFLDSHTRWKTPERPSLNS